MVLVGTKCDASADMRNVSYEEGAALAREHGMPFIEVSAKEVCVCMCYSGCKKKLFKFF